MHQKPIEEMFVSGAKSVKVVYALADKVARLDSIVLITGESGTGKEVMARYIHVHSRRAKMPYMAVNCAALTESLLESELFGHAQGAFTGATRLHKGIFEQANGGTVFLDEVGTSSLGLQCKLLRFLQDGCFHSVGGMSVKYANVRIIAATNADLRQAIEARTFRNDLFYRLNVIAMRMPALRERREDIEPLSIYFVKRFAKQFGKPVPAISAPVRDRLLAYTWPGNIRELENNIERAMVSCDGDAIKLSDVSDELRDAVPILHRRMVDRECHFCHKHFFVLPCNANRAYCSVECRDKSRKMLVPELVCAFCNKPFRPVRFRKKKPQRTCSLSCKTKLAYREGKFVGHRKPAEPVHTECVPHKEAAVPQESPPVPQAAEVASTN